MNVKADSLCYTPLRRSRPSASLVVVATVTVLFSHLRVFILPLSVRILILQTTSQDVATWLELVWELCGSAQNCHQAPKLFVNAIVLACHPRPKMKNVCYPQ